MPICSGQVCRAEITGLVTDQIQAIRSRRGRHGDERRDENRMENADQSIGAILGAFLPAGSCKSPSSSRVRAASSSRYRSRSGRGDPAGRGPAGRRRQRNVKVNSVAPPVATATASLSGRTSTRTHRPVAAQWAERSAVGRPDAWRRQHRRTGQNGMLQESFRISGGRPIDTNFTLDGGNNMNAYFAMRRRVSQSGRAAEFTIVPAQRHGARGPWNRQRFRRDQVRNQRVSWNSI